MRNRCNGNRVVSLYLNIGESTLEVDFEAHDDVLRWIKARVSTV